MKKNLIFPFLLVLLLSSSAVQADENSSLEINHDIIIQNDDSAGQNQFDTIKSNLFLEKQEQSNDRVKQEENKEVYGSMNHLFSGNKIKTKNEEEFVKTSFLFGDNYSILDDYSKNDFSSNGEYFNLSKIFLIIIGATCLAIIGWALGKSKYFQSIKSRKRNERQYNNRS